jgi:dihydrofolate reductase
MQKLSLHLSMSLDGFVTGPNVGAEHPLGEDGERLHDWMFDRKTEADAEVRDEIDSSTGALIIGKRMFDLGFEPWGDPPPFGKPVFVLTHERREPLPMQGGTTYVFASDGIEAALDEARAAAGDRDVGLWGGADVAQQYFQAGLLDELDLHIVPMLLGGGIRLFDGVGRTDLEQTRVIETPAATHVRYRVVK